MIGLPWDEAAGISFGADWLLAALAPASEFGRRRFAASRAFAPGDEAAARLALAAVARCAAAIDPARIERLRSTLAAAPDPAAALGRAAAGDVLGDVDFFELSRFLEALADVRALLADGAFGLEPPSGGEALATLLAPGRGVRRSFYLADAFDAELAALRGTAAAADARYVSARARDLSEAARALGVEHVRDGEFTVMRDSLRAALPAGVRVVREAATYLACELMLDGEALAALAARDAAERRVAEAEEAVRARLSLAAGQAAPALLHACDVLGELDCFAARVRFAQRFGCVLPRVADASEPLAFEEARFLPLAEALSEGGRDYVPISLELDGVAVVTGPNMGGKTAALRTCAFVAACVALGVPVPAHAARVPLFDAIAWIGIGRADGGDASERRLLSSFGAEVSALRTFFDRAPRTALVLVDEFARTTTPREGRALLVALLERLHERGAYALAATHLHGVARDASATHYAIAGLRELPRATPSPLGLNAALDLIAASMDYRLRRTEEERAESGDALALAEVLGLDAALVARARAELTRRS